MQFVYTKNWNDQILTQNKHDMMIFWKTGLNYRNFLKVNFYIDEVFLYFTPVILIRCINLKMSLSHIK